jgi:hypothetical protein
MQPEVNRNCHLEFSSILLQVDFSEHQFQHYVQPDSVGHPSRETELDPAAECGVRTT